MATRTTSKSKSQTNGRASSRNGDLKEAQPVLKLSRREIQPYGTVREMPIVLEEKARRESCETLNQVLADSIILYSLYKKAHWQVAGPTFYQLHELFDSHAAEQLALIDMIAERVQLLGGIAIADPRHVGEVTNVERAPDGAEEVPSTITRLLRAHETTIEAIREGIKITEENEDFGSNDMLMGDVLREHEKEVWFLASHLVDTPLIAK